MKERNRSRSRVCEDGRETGDGKYAERNELPGAGTSFWKRPRHLRSARRATAGYPGSGEEVSKGCGCRHRYAGSKEEQR